MYKLLPRLFFVLLATAACGHETEQDLVSAFDITAEVAYTMKILNGHPAIGPDMVPAYDVKLMLKNKTSETVRTTNVQVVFWVDAGDALLIALFPPDPDKGEMFVFEPHESLEFAIDTDGYMRGLQVDKPIRMGVALNDEAPFAQDTILSVSLPEVETLPAHPAVLSGEIEAIILPLVEPQLFDFKGGRTPKDLKEWPRQPAFMRKYDRYIAVYLYAQQQTPEPPQPAG